MDTQRITINALLQGMAGDACKIGSEMAEHMPTLYMLAHQWSFGHIVELGVHRGWSTTALFAGATASGARLISYDKNPGVRGALAKNLCLVADSPLLSSWEFRCKDSVAAAADFPDGSVSLWFLDTLHTLDQTRKELAAWYPKIHPDGIMCGHDYLLESYMMGPNEVICGVKQAVDEFAAQHGARFSLQVMPSATSPMRRVPSAIEGSCGFFLLKPRPNSKAKP